MEGKRKLIMVAIGNVIVALLGLAEGVFGLSIPGEVYWAIAAVTGGGTLGNGLEHVGRGMATPKRTREMLDGVTK